MKRVAIKLPGRLPYLPSVSLRKIEAAVRRVILARKAREAAAETK